MVRYDVVASACYRFAGNGGWLDATTVNISHLGLLLRTRQPAPPLSTAIELRVRLRAAGLAGADVACTGHVVWAQSQPSGEVLLAITIGEYRFDKAALTSSTCGSPSAGTGSEAANDFVSSPMRKQES